MSSIFNQQPQKSSPFPGFTTSSSTAQPAQTSSVFGNFGSGASGATPAPPTGGLFANLGSGQASSAPSQPAQTSAPSFKNPFGNLGGGQAAPRSLASFGALGGASDTPSPPTQPSGGLSILGAGSAASQPTQPSSGFSILGAGSSAAAQPATTTSSNTFGSLGGTTLQGSTGTNKLFGGFNTTSAASSATPQPASAAPSNPFGSLLGSTAAPKPPQPSNIFGGLGATKPAAPSLFGPTGLTTGTNQQSSGAAQPGIIPSLLGPNANASQHQGPAAHTAQAAQEAGHTAYFSSLLEKNKKRARGVEEANGFNEVPSLQLGLGDIAKRIKELGSPQARRDRVADTKAHYLLAASGVNPGSTLRDLNALGADTAARNGTLLQPEFDPDSHKYVEQMQQQMTLKMINEGIERANRRFDEYLQEHMDMNWEQQKKRVYEHFGLAPRGLDGDSASEGRDFGNTGGFGRSSRRGRGLQDRSTQGSLSRSVLGPSGMQKSVIGSPAVGGGNMQLFGDSTEKTNFPVQEGRNIREKQTNLANTVQRLNGSRLEEKFFPLLGAFHNVEAGLGSDTPQPILDSYKAIIEIVDEENTRTFKPRKFANEYLDENLNSEKAIKTRQRIIDGSRRALEKQFFASLTSNVERNVKEANLGGAPTRINKVRAYIRIRFSRKDLASDGTFLQQLGDDYCWALIFFLLRSGFYDEAAQYVADNSNPFKTIDRMFATYMTAYVKSPDRRLSPQQQTKINNEYMSRMRLAPENSLDPYRMACYKILGRCELGKRSLDLINQGVEDWMWLQFCLAREANRAEELATEVYGLREVQETIREIGQRHFSKAADNPTGYGTYFYLQILGGLFEQAVAYLYQHSYISAVHFAIALDFYGLLRVSDFNASETDLLTYTTRESPQINFDRMLGYYTRDFRASSVVSALDYLCLIHLNADLPGQIGRTHASICHESLRELVLETREFAQLLGDIYADGTRIKGAIEQRLPLIGLTDQEDFLHAVTIQAARVADDAGRTTDAVLLYHLAEEYNNVIAILNRALSDALAADLGSAGPEIQPLKPRADATPDNEAGIDNARGSSLSLASVTNPVILSRHFISLYDSDASLFQKILPTTRTVCGQLMELAGARGRIEARHWAEALDLISNLNLVPLNAAGSIPAIRHAASNLNEQPSLVSRLVGNVLLWCFLCVGKMREELLGGGDGGMGMGGGGGEFFDNRTKADMREDMVGKAKDLMVFAGLVRLRLGKGVWDGIVNGAMELGVV